MNKRCIVLNIDFTSIFIPWALCQCAATQIQIKDLRLALSNTEHALAELRLVGDRRSNDGEASEFSHGELYVAASASDVLAGQATNFDENDEGERTQASALDAEVEYVAEVADALEDEATEDEEKDPATEHMTAQLQRIFKLTIACGGGASKELGKAEFDLLGQARLRRGGGGGSEPPRACKSCA